MNTEKNLFVRARECLMLNEADDKGPAVHALYEEWQVGELSLDPVDLDDVTEAGTPEYVRRVSPRNLPKRGFTTPEGRATLIHAVTHIEFSAINLALDAVYRFRDMPADYYEDWLRIAKEEVDHFFMMRKRLRDLDHDYGDYSTHQGLWDTAVKTAHDPLVRMAIVPRVLEARGLDVNPGMMDKFRKAGDDVTADALAIILRDEIGHVEAGTRWYHYLCQQRDVEPEATYFELLAEYAGTGVRCPLHKEARLQAGFSQSELDQLEELCARS